MRIGSFASWEERIATVKESGLSKLVGPSMERWFSAAFREHRSVEMQGYANMLLRIPADGYLGVHALRDADLRERRRKLITRHSSYAVIRTLRRRRISAELRPGDPRRPLFSHQSGGAFSAYRAAGIHGAPDDGVFPGGKHSS
jgi:hypothetical protein